MKPLLAFRSFQTFKWFNVFKKNHCEKKLNEILLSRLFDRNPTIDNLKPVLSYVEVSKIQNRCVGRSKKKLPTMFPSSRYVFPNGKLLRWLLQRNIERTHNVRVTSHHLVFNSSKRLLSKKLLATAPFTFGSSIASWLISV